MTSKFLHSLREENLITLEGEYEEDYTLEIPSKYERVCYINHEWPELDVDIQYPHLKAQHLDSVHQFPILRSKAYLSCPLPIPPKQLGNGSGFSRSFAKSRSPTILQCFFLPLHLHSSQWRRSNHGWLSFRAHVNRKVFLLCEESFHNFKPVYFKVFGAPRTTHFWETQEWELTKVNVYWNKNFEAPRIEYDDLMPEEWAVI